MRGVLLALLVAGCAASPSDPRAAACERQATDDPAVQAAVLRANNPLQEVRVPAVEEEQRARRRAVRRCLDGDSGARRGGVEPVQPN